ncbi:MAG: TIGR03905 family TSCPD domain-containing protein [Oscillospiraceae bacterium]|nr:TIGR03905 family TSCPD domain-containing protein [Oscillospiraceae bacterium]
MQTYDFQPNRNVCSKRITFSIEDGVIHDVKFHGGCNGNAKGISNLLEGANIRDTINRLENVTCGDRGTSCPAELAKALKEAVT